MEAEIVGMHCTAQWKDLEGQVVEVFLNGRNYRRAFVDAAMPDSSGLWLAADGAQPREYIEKAAMPKVRQSRLSDSP